MAGRVADLASRVAGLALVVSWRSLRRVVPVSQYNPAVKPRAVSQPTRHPPIAIQNFVSRQSPWPGHERTHCRTPQAQAGRIVAVLWPYRRPCYIPARPCRGPPCCAQANLLALCHDTIHCILTQMGSSPSAAF